MDCLDYFLTWVLIREKKNEKVKYIEILHKLQSTYVSYLLYKLPEKKSSIKVKCINWFYLMWECNSYYLLHFSPIRA